MPTVSIKIKWKELAPFLNAFQGILGPCSKPLGAVGDSLIFKGNGTVLNTCLPLEELVSEKSSSQF